MRVFNFKDGTRFSFLVSENPSCKQGIKNRLDQRRPEETNALFVVDIESQPESLPVVIQQRLNGFQVIRHPGLCIPGLSRKYLRKIGR